MHQMAKLPLKNSCVYSFNLPVADQAKTHIVSAMQSNGEIVSSFQIKEAAIVTKKVLKYGQIL